jgi:hypothetical protein
VPPDVSIRSYLKSVLSYKFLNLDCIETLYIYARKDVRIRGDF